MITDLGLGLFADVDVVIGCLDNREARLWVNRQCWKVGTPWVDSGIQEIQGVVKVFVPPDSACYECAMTERDYQLLNLRYSCPLLRRDQILEGKVPTAPTIASMMAALEVQEALKLIHGMPVAAGTALVFNGVTNQFYTTQLPFRDDCLSHETYPEPVALPLGRDHDRAPSCSTPRGRRSAGPLTLALDRDLVAAVDCPRAAGTSRSSGRGRGSRRPRRSARAAASRPGPRSSAPSTKTRPLAARPLAASASRLTISSGSTANRLGLLPPGRRPRGARLTVGAGFKSAPARRRTRVSQPPLLAVRSRSGVRPAPTESESPSPLLLSDGLRCSSNQSANWSPCPSAMSGQPWPPPGLTTSFASTPAALSFSTIISACWIGTSLSASPWMIRVGGSSAVTWLIGEILRPISQDLRLVGDRDERLPRRVELVEVERGREVLAGCPGPGRSRPACRS